MSSPKRESKNFPLYVIGDEPIRSWEHDHLGISPYADVIVGAALGNPGPFTIGVFGDWGQGKTSVLRAAESRLRAPSVDDNAPLIIPVWFNAWRYEREAQPIVPLVATIQREVLRRVADTKGGWEKLGDGPKEFVKRLVGGAASLLSAVKFSAEVESGVTGLAKATGGIEFEGTEFVAALTKIFGPLSKVDQSTLGVAIDKCLPLAAFDRLEQLANMGDSSTPRVVVFIDDLDRCEPDKAFELLEAVKVVLAQPGFIFVLALNKTIVDSYVETLWKKRLIERHAGQAARYLDKIVQLPLYLRSHERGFQGLVDHILDTTLDGKLPKDTLGVLCGVRAHLGQATKFGPRTLIRRVNALLVDQRLRPSLGEHDPKIVKNLKDAEFLGLCLVQRTLADELESDQLDFLSRDHEVCQVLLTKSLADAYEHFRLSQAGTAASLEESPASRRYPQGPPQQSSRFSEILTLVIRLLLSKPATYVLSTEHGKRWLSSGDLRELVRDFITEQRDIDKEPLADAGSTASLTGQEGTVNRGGRNAWSVLEEQRMIVKRAVHRSLNVSSDDPLPSQVWATVKELDFSGEPLTDIGVALLASKSKWFPGLRGLTLMGTGITLDGVKSLASGSTSLPGLTTLILRYTQVTDDGVRLLASKESNLSKLTNLDLGGTTITDQGVELIASIETGLSCLTQLGLADTEVTDEGVRALALTGSGLSSLTSLKLAGTKITDEGVKALARKQTGLSNLTNLDLRETKITDKGISALASKETGLSNLTVLHLGSTKITDEGISALASKETGMSKLTNLDLAGTTITDRGISALASKEAGLSRLTNLNLGHTQITDDGVKALASKETALSNLTSLGLAGLEITDDGVKALASKERGLSKLINVEFGNRSMRFPA